jgi:hypothetical protein
MYFFPKHCYVLIDYGFSIIWIVTCQNIGNLSLQPTRVSNTAKRVNMCLHLHNERILVNFHTMMTLKTSSVNFTYGFLRKRRRNRYVLKENKLEVARLIRQ